VRAHNGNAGNERADALAAQGAREAKAELAAAEPRRRRR
jgi:ribonuclease HI